MEKDRDRAPLSRPEPDGLRTEKMLGEQRAFYKPESVQSGKHSWRQIEYPKAFILLDKKTCEPASYEKRWQARKRLKQIIDKDLTDENGKKIYWVDGGNGHYHILARRSAVDPDTHHWRKHLRKQIMGDEQPHVEPEDESWARDMHELLPTKKGNAR